MFICFSSGFKRYFPVGQRVDMERRKVQCCLLWVRHQAMSGKAVVAFFLRRDCFHLQQAIVPCIPYRQGCVEHCLIRRCLDMVCRRLFSRFWPVASVVAYQRWAGLQLGHSRGVYTGLRLSTTFTGVPDGGYGISCLTGANPRHVRCRLKRRTKTKLRLAVPSCHGRHKHPTN